MSGDYSRLAFDPRHDYSGVLLQQGRPLTDADWNDAEAQAWRRMQATAHDTFSESVVPQTTPHGFEIAFTAGLLTIGRGRMYVDGLLAENHGAGDPEWDTALAESFGSEPLDAAEQPWWPDAPALPESGKHLAFLDVWLREATQFERPELLEPAIGVDTSARLETAWQVRLLDLSEGGSDVICATPDEDVPGWAALIAPSAGRLSTATGAAVEPNPCLIPPGGGYKGLENQLYRIEIHQGGPQEEATFKWSRDNASVTARVLRIVGTDQVIVDSVGKDTVLRFNPGDWVEIVDDALELGPDPATGRPRHVGQLYRIATGGVDDATRALTLEPSAQGLGAFPADSQGLLDPARHTRVRRWDHKGIVREADGTEWVDVNANGGEIPLPPAGTQLQLEHGILVAFDLEPSIADGEFHSGDWWVFTARAGDEADIETLDLAPPRGVHHHYVRLAVVDFPADVEDCRVPWPRPTGGGGGGEAEACCCTVCVSPEQHNSGSFTVQKAIDLVKAAGGTVCLLPGRYELREPLRIQNGRAVTVVGHGAATVLAAPAGGFQIFNSQSVRLHDLSIEGPKEAPGQYAAVAAANVMGLWIQRLDIQVGPAVKEGFGIVLGGVAAEVTVRDNRINAPIGIATIAAAAGAGSIHSTTFAAGPASATATANLVLDDNLLQCGANAIRFDEKTASQMLTRIHGNRMLGCEDAAVLLPGLVAPGATIVLDGNHLNVKADGIVCAPGDYRITDNDLAFSGAAEAAREGISVRPGHGTEMGGNYQILGNRAAGFPLAGIALSVGVRSAMIKHNRIERSSAGVSIKNGLPSSSIIVDNNVITDLLPAPAAATGMAATLGVVRGIAISGAGVANIGGNVIDRLADAAKGPLIYVGIQVAQSARVSIGSNDIVGPPGAIAVIAGGIMLAAVAGPVQVTHNKVRRLILSEDPRDASLWIPLLMAATTSGAAPGGAAGGLGASFAGLSAAHFEAFDFAPLGHAFAAAMAPAGAAPSTGAAGAPPATVSGATLSGLATPAALGALSGALAAAGIAGTGTAAAAAPPVVRPLVAITGNELEGGGRTSAVSVSGPYDCQFGSNHCVHRNPLDQGKDVSDVELSTNVVIASNNRIFGGGESLDIRVTPNPGAVTVLGNVTRGKILVNGGGLAGPWPPLNVQGL